MKETRTESE
jgi:hypothetical protein